MEWGLLFSQACVVVRRLPPVSETQVSDVDSLSSDPAFYQGSWVRDGGQQSGPRSSRTVWEIMARCPHVAQSRGEPVSAAPGLRLLLSKKSGTSQPRCSLLCLVALGAWCWHQPSPGVCVLLQPALGVGTGPWAGRWVPTWACQEFNHQSLGDQGVCVILTWRCYVRGEQGQPPGEWGRT